MAYGGYHPYPRRFGGGKPRLQIIHESLNAQRGTALDTSDSNKLVWIENMALARAISGAWSTNARLGLQWDPNRTTTLLPRWEQLLRLVVSPSDTEPERRRRLAAHWARFGAPVNFGRLTANLMDALGNVFVAIEFIGPSLAVVHVPDGTYPFGSVAAGYPWFSTLMRMLVRVQVPSGYTEVEFLEAVSKVFPLLEGIMPAWMTWDLYRHGPISAAVTDGPSAAGFYLDDDHNLNWELFDE